MNSTSGFTKEVTIEGYEINKGFSEKCKNEKNPNGEYFIAKFWYSENTDVEKEKYEAHGNIGRYFTVARNIATELIEELRNNNYCLEARITGQYNGNEFRVYGIDTDY